MMIDFSKDKSVEPVDENLSVVLGESFAAYQALVRKLADFEAELEWRFYKDGGWLAKITRKKKTLIWGWPAADFFGTNFIFQNKPHLREGVLALDIADKWKDKFETTPGDKYFSVKIEVRGEGDLSDLYKMIAYKMRAK
ncbi:MAG: DUF3788 domain-containing protein [Turicibacter sp.]|nr:DUF3788 domain-containing protein [Turicibacter sp.]